LYRQSVELRRKLSGEGHPRLATAMHNLATLLRDKGDYDEAGVLFRQSLEMRRKLLSDEHPQVGASLHSLAVLLYLKGERNEAEKTQRQAIDTYQKSLKPDHWLIHRCRSHLGKCLIKLKRYREAEEQLLTGYAGLKAALGDRDVETQKAVSHLIELYESWGNPEKAMPYHSLPHANPGKLKK
jgi:tetratricopeptide (TPR) repeat protein